MFEMLMWLYDYGNGKLTEVGLSNAVLKEWITEIDKQKILEATKQ